MNLKANVNYKQIAEAIDYINQYYKSHPPLNEIAKHVHLSPSHFQKLFTDWIGTSPEKFLPYISIERAKNILKEHQTSLIDIAYETGLSSTSYLHDLFMNIEEMTPEEYKHGGKNLSINYDFNNSPFGSLIIASTKKGICYMAFYDDDQQSAFDHLKLLFPNATFHHQSDQIQENALRIFQNDRSQINKIKLHLKGTNFQLKVWGNLLKIPMGKLITYGVIANQIGHPKAYRAVGTAIGKNPISFLIPCHRVIQSSGMIGGYMWGPTRKAALIGWEAVKSEIKKDL